MRSWRSFLLLIPPFASIGLAESPSPAGTAPSLYLVENVATEGVVRTRALVGLTLGKDDRIIKETILSEDQRFFGHIGGHALLPGDRFLATAYGGVIDLVDKEVIHAEEDGKLLGFEGGRVVFHMENANREPGYFAFDTAARSLRKLDKPGHWDLPGAKSPDGTRSVHQGFDGVLRLYRVDGTTKDLSRTFRIDYSPLSSFLSQEVPCLWMDDRRLLTQEANGKLVLVDTDGKVERLLEIPGAPRVITPPRLGRDPRGRIIYTCAGDDYLIDVGARSAVLLRWYALGHDFEASVEADPLRRHEIRHAGRSIGRWKFSPHEVETGPGLIAFPFVSLGDNLGSPEGVALWSPGTGWQSVKLWPNDLVGWTGKSAAATP